jgi:hypothetical protein
MLDQIAHYKAVRARIAASRPTLVEIAAPTPEAAPRVYIAPIETPEQRRARMLAGAPGNTRWRGAIFNALDEFGVTWCEIIETRSKAKHFVVMRWRVFAALHGLGLSLSHISRLTGRDHTTIMYGIKKLAEIEADHANG